MDELVIIGAGDHARVAIETARALGLLVRVVVEPAPGRLRAAELNGVPVVTDLDIVAGAPFVVAMGRNRARADLFDRAHGHGGHAATLVHPTAIVLEGATIGAGTHICAGAILGIDARIGKNVIVNTGATLDHDAKVGDHAFIGPGVHLAGRVSIGAGAHVGIGCTVIEHRKIGAWSLVAAGATVVADVGPDARVAGVPARPMAAHGGDPMHG